MNLELITKYHSNGQKEYEGYYDETQPVGDQTAWYENGNKEFESIELSESVELCTHWHENGQIKSKGIRTNYFENGLWNYLDPVDRNPQKVCYYYFVYITFRDIPSMQNV